MDTERELKNEKAEENINPVEDGKSREGDIYDGKKNEGL